MRDMRSIGSCASSCTCGSSTSRPNTAVAASVPRRSAPCASASFPPASACSSRQCRGTRRRSLSGAPAVFATVTSGWRRRRYRKPAEAVRGKSFAKPLRQGSGQVGTSALMNHGAGPAGGDILTRILAAKAKEVAAARAAKPLAALRDEARTAPPVRDFAGALRSRIAASAAAVIAEIKKASPSRGVLRPIFDPAGIARRYEVGGAACPAVLTDREDFQGAPEHLVAPRAPGSLPVLPTDSVLYEYQAA